MHLKQKIYISGHRSGKKQTATNIEMLQHAQYDMYEHLKCSETCVVTKLCIWYLQRSDSLKHNSAVEELLPACFGLTPGLWARGVWFLHSWVWNYWRERGWKALCGAFTLLILEPGCYPQVAKNFQFNYNFPWKTVLIAAGRPFQTLSLMYLFIAGVSLKINQFDG